MTTNHASSAGRTRPSGSRTLWTLAWATGLLMACAAPVPEAPAPAPSAAPAPAAPPVAEAPRAAPPAAPAPAPAPPPPTLPFDEAVLAAANQLLGKAQLPPGSGRHNILVDPLIDGFTGVQTAASQAMGAKIVKLVRDQYAQQYEVQPFTTANVQRGPLILVGTFTGVNAERKTEGKREAYRICLALADLKTGKLVSKGLAFAKPDGVDPAPLPFYRDAPAQADDPATSGYIRTCQGTRAGDPIHPLYVDRIVASATLAEAADAYAARQYPQALKLYEAAQRTPGGDQLRTYTGLYLTNWRLNHKEEAAKAFGRIVDTGLTSKRLGVKFLFRPGTSALWSDPKVGPPLPYPMWIQQIAAASSVRNSCLEVVGHSSPTGPEPVNERLSLLRAESLKKEIERWQPTLSKRMIANGVGSKEPLIGNGRDDASDALDRRVEFKVVTC